MQRCERSRSSARARGLTPVTGRCESITTLRSTCDLHSQSTSCTRCTRSLHHHVIGADVGEHGRMTTCIDRTSTRASRRHAGRPARWSRDARCAWRGRTRRSCQCIAWCIMPSTVSMPTWPRDALRRRRLQATRLERHDRSKALASLLMSSAFGPAPAAGTARPSGRGGVREVGFHRKV